MRLEFQSTRPARGATKLFWQGMQKRSISIHAPREGRDHNIAETPTLSKNFNPRAPRGARPSASLAASSSSNFNPRAPRGARPSVAGLVIRVDDISIHAPREGRDLSRTDKENQQRISIHAPREGRDAAGFPVAPKC